MSFDNRIFNVNGRGDDLLLDTLRLAFELHGKNTKCVAWSTSVKYGMVLCWWTGDKATPLPAGLSADDCLPLVKSYLSSDDAKKVKLDGWDRDADHDGSNVLGWRVSLEDWGHVEGAQNPICAVKPVYLWCGK